jgi:hypothetical protein
MSRYSHPGTNTVRVPQQDTCGQAQHCPRIGERPIDVLVSYCYSHSGFYTCSPPSDALLQMLILQETAVVLSKWKEARGEGGMSVQLTAARGEALVRQTESAYVYGDMVTFSKMLKDSSMVRMVAQRVTDRCVVRSYVTCLVSCLCIRQFHVSNASIQLEVPECTVLWCVGSGFSCCSGISHFEL